MRDKIYLIKDNAELVEMEEHDYEKEILLQKLIADYPNLLAGEQMDPENSRRWLLVTQELALKSDEEGFKNFYLDHLFLDQDGIPTLVEVKRSSDTRIRREVIGQMFDYAANAVVYLPVEEIKERVESQYDDPALIEDFLDPQISMEVFWQKVKTNLNAGKIRMVFVADELPRELKRIIEFLNEQMDPAEVLGVEIKQYVDAEKKIKTLVPRVIGQTMGAQIKKGIGKKEALLDQDSFLNEVDDSGKVFFLNLFHFAENNGLIIKWGTKGFSLNIKIKDTLISLLQGYSNLSRYKQSMFSTMASISKKIKDGDELVQQYLNITELKNFNKVGNGFGYKIDSKINEKELQAFNEFLSKFIISIKEKGLLE